MDSKPQTTSKPVGYIDLLRRNRSFRQLWLGQVVSQMGDWFDTIALYTIILNLTGSGRDVGLLLVARFVPSFFFGPLSGVVADRFSGRTIMIVSDVLPAFCAPLLSWDFSLSDVRTNYGSFTY